jgi:hypothetical protein
VVLDGCGLSAYRLPVVAGLYFLSVVPQYRSNSQNIGSLGVAKALNFHEYFRSENVVLQTS